MGEVATRYVTIGSADAPLQLERGGQLGPVTLAYETYGTLAPDGGNAILAYHALSGDAQTDRIEELLHKYPEDPSRVPGGMNISLLDSNPEPPATCGPDGSMCDCFDIGF